MPVSSLKVVLISIFLICGMLLAGMILQPEASLQAWDVQQSDYPANSSPQDRLSFLLSYAILAPSSHNSQPWNFNVSEDCIRIYADETRWLNVADPDQREMYISLGCALENLAIAAEHFGYSVNVSYFPGPRDLVAEMRLQSEANSPSDLNSRLFSAIISRQTNRHPYESRRLSDADLELLSSLAVYDPSLYRQSQSQSQQNQNQSQNQSQSQIPAPLPEAYVVLSDDLDTIALFRQLTVEADQILYSNADFKSELGHWLSLGSMGPTGLEAKAAQLAVVFLDMVPDQMKNDAELINSTPYIGFVCTENYSDDILSQNEMENASERALDLEFKVSALCAGRAFERFWLAATSMGLSLHPMSQALETAETKEELSRLLPSQPGNISLVQQTFRLGYASSPGNHTPRRPLSDMLI